MVRTTEFHGNNAGECVQIDEEYKPQMPSLSKIKNDENLVQNDENAMIVDANKKIDFNDCEQQKIIINTALLSKSF